MKTGTEYTLYVGSFGNCLKQHSADFESLKRAAEEYAREHTDERVKISKSYRDEHDDFRFEWVWSSAADDDDDEEDDEDAV